MKQENERLCLDTGYGKTGRKNNCQNRGAEKRKARIKTVFCSVLCVLLSGGASFSGGSSVFAPIVFAAESGPSDSALSGEAAEKELYEAADGGQISEERLSDTRIEYEELGSLIHKNNAAVKTVSSVLENQSRSYRSVRDSLRWEKNDAEWQKDEAERDGDGERYVEYAGYEAIYEGAVKSYNQILKNLQKASFNQSRLTLEKQLTSAAQSLFLSWQAADAQEEYLAKLEQVFEKTYQMAGLKQQAGMATEEDVLEAYQSWQSAADARSTTASARESAYENLCVLLGVETDGSMQLVPISGWDWSCLEELNLEQETQNALINQTSLSATRKTAAATSSEKAKKNRTVTEQREEITLDMQELFSQLIQAKLSYDAACVSWEAEQTAWQNAQSRQALGMLSTEQFLQEEMQYLQKKSEAEAAELSLLQAWERYQWAARGV